jgi:transcriptional regulator with XRE-family HTH domain
MPEIAERFPFRLRELREAAGLSQAALGQKVGVSQGTINHYERNARQPTWANVLALCDALGVDCAAFLVAASSSPRRLGRPRKQSEPDDELAAALRALLRMGAGFYVGFAGMLEVGQLENLNYWVESKDHTGTMLWQKDDMPLDEAVGHFLRIRRERELGYDIESDLIQKLKPIDPG